MDGPVIVNPGDSEERRIIKAIKAAHFKAVDLFAKGAVAAKEAGALLMALMVAMKLKSKEEVWRYVLKEGDLTEDQLSYRTVAAYMKTSADWEWMESLLGDELYSMTQNAFLTEAAKLNAKKRRKAEPAQPAATDGGADTKGAEGEQTDEPKPPAATGGKGDDADAGGADPGGDRRHLDPVVVLTTLCTSLQEIVEADIKEEEKGEVEKLIEKALQIIDALKKRLH